MLWSSPKEAGVFQDGSPVLVGAKEKDAGGYHDDTL